MKAPHYAGSRRTAVAMLSRSPVVSPATSRIAAYTSTPSADAARSTGTSKPARNSDSAICRPLPLLLQVLAQVGGVELEVTVLAEPA